MSIVDEEKGTSAMQIGEFSNKLLLENNSSYYLIFSNGAYKVEKSERNMNCPVEQNAPSDLWKKKIEVETRKLNCCGLNDLLAFVACDSNRINGTLIVPCLLLTLVKDGLSFSFYLNKGCLNANFKQNRGLVIFLRESQFNLIQIDNKKCFASTGGSIVFSTPKWYAIQQFIEDINNFIIVRLFNSHEAVLNYKKMGR